MLGKKAYLVFFLLLLLGVRIYYSFSSLPHYAQGQQISLSGMLTQEPQIFAERQSFFFQGVSISTSTDSEYHYGDYLYIKGTISCKQNVAATVCEPRLSNPKIQVSITATTPLFHTLVSFRQFVSNHIRKVLPSDLASLFIGITFGSKEGFSDNVKTAFANTGTTHVIAASGMNVTLLIGFLVPLFSRFLNRRKAGITVIAFVVLYAILAQLSASIVRASIMGILALLGSITGRQTNAGYFLLLAGYGMVFFNPQTLLDIGFQLSFMATVGLIYFKPIIDTYWKKKPKVPAKEVKEKWYHSVIEDMTTTFAAQITTLPILFANLGQVSFMSIIVNALVLWTVPILMVVGFIYAIIAFIPMVPNILLLLCYPLLIYFLKVIVFFDRPFFLIQFDSFSLWFAIGYYLLLTSAYLYFSRSISKV